MAFHMQLFIIEFNLNASIISVISSLLNDKVHSTPNVQQSPKRLPTLSHFFCLRYPDNPVIFLKEFLWCFVILHVIAIVKRIIEVILYNIHYPLLSNIKEVNFYSRDSKRICNYIIFFINFSLRLCLPTESNDILFTIHILSRSKYFN
uniref:Uncharacterized protein n=1 Tax=Schizaphis graminum TaxID=13262 RepID=A0A2S2NKP1_SCHGA